MKDMIRKVLVWLGLARRLKAPPEVISMQWDNFGKGYRFTLSDQRVFKVLFMLHDDRYELKVVNVSDFSESEELWITQRVNGSALITRVLGMFNKVHNSECRWILTEISLSMAKLIMYAK